jgi:RNA polymerase sigma-70 factor (ECF subfamily)
VTSVPSITELLLDWRSGNRASLDELTRRVYPELHELARTYLNRGPHNQTLQPTALINELYLRLIRQSPPIQWQNRAHFFGIAARLMRIILVDYARTRSARKRGGGSPCLPLDETAALSPDHPPGILEIDEALRRLADMDERKAGVIELRYFGGMTREEIASALGLTVATVKRDLRLAEAWLRRELSPAG